jgi:hypothetical protein
VAGVVIIIIIVGDVDPSVAKDGGRGSYGRASGGRGGVVECPEDARDVRGDLLSLRCARAIDAEPRRGAPMGRRFAWTSLSTNQNAPNPFGSAAGRTNRGGRRGEDPTRSFACHHNLDYELRAPL